MEELIWKKYRTSAICPRCGKELYTSDIHGYSFVCEECEENFYTIEVKGCSADFWDEITEKLYQLWRISIPTTIEDWERKVSQWENISEKYNCDFLGYDDAAGFVDIGWKNSFPESKILNQFVKEIEKSVI